MTSTFIPQRQVFNPTKMSPAEFILAETADLRSELLQHPIYSQINDVASLQIFMQHHVFAVLDFMWLLKRLQKELTCTETPWLPILESYLARFVNEIVLGEESDEDGRGGFCSHFELYLSSMNDVQANRDQIFRFTQSLREGLAVSQALKLATAPASVQNFVSFTHQTVTTCSAAEVACVFCFGREDIIPEMLQRLLTTFEDTQMQVPSLSYYIRRHIELDGDHHGPLSRRMVNLLCVDVATTEKCVLTTRTAIQQRIQLWDVVLSGR